MWNYIQNNVTIKLNNITRRLNLFYFKCFMIVIMIIELIMSYIVVSAFYKEYKYKRVKLVESILLFSLIIATLSITLGFMIFL